MSKRDCFCLFLQWVRCYRRQVPDFAVVVAHGAVSRELATVCRVVDAHACPAFLVAIGAGDEFLGIDKTAEVRRCQPGIMGTGNRVDDPVEQVFFELVEVAAFQ